MIISKTIIQLSNEVIFKFCHKRISSHVPGVCISIVRYLRLYQWQIVELYLCFSHISGKLDLDQIGSSIYHPVLDFQESLDLQSKNFNFISGTCYRLCLCFGHILGKWDLDQRLKVAVAGATE